MNWKNWAICKPFIDIYNSFFNNDKGISFRKLYAILAMHYAFQLQQSIVDDDIKRWVIMMWMTLGATCIGLVTIPDLIKFLSSKKDEEIKS